MRYPTVHPDQLIHGQWYWVKRNKYLVVIAMMADLETATGKMKLRNGTHGTLFDPLDAVSIGGPILMPEVSDGE